MIETFEIYFRDLNKDAQERFLTFQEIENPEDGNYDVFPIAIIELDKEEGPILD
jgi:hypothetical protein